MMKNDVHGRSDPGMFLQTNGKVDTALLVVQ